MKRANGISLALLLSALLAQGCGQEQKGEHEVYPVTGTVTYKGAPVAGATVSFLSQERQVSAYGRTDDAGRFQLTTYAQNDGAVAGKHKVTIKKMLSGGEPKEIEPGVLDPRGAVTEARSAIPVQYGNPVATPLTADVTTSGSNDFPFDLK